MAISPSQNDNKKNQMVKSILDPQQFYKSIEKANKEQNFFPLYYFFGDEPYLLNQATDYLKHCSLQGGASDFNFMSFYATDADIGRVRDEVETLPMMSSRRVVLLKEVQELTEKEWDILEPIIKSAVNTSVFILTASKVDRRKRFFKLLTDHAVSVEFKKPFDNQIPGWIQHIGKNFGLIFSDEALQLLHRLVGNQLTEIDSEIRKLVDFLGDRKKVEIEDIAKCVSRTKEESVFELTEAIAKGDRVQSLIHLVQLLDQGQSELGIVSMIARHIRILLLIKQGQEQGLAGTRLAQYAQVPNYFLQQYLSQSRTWSVKKLESTLLVLSETDKALKSSPLSSHIWLENLVLKVCSFHAAANNSVSA